MKRDANLFTFAWSDPQFTEDYERMIVEPNNPISGEEIEKVLAQSSRDPKIMQIYKDISGLGRLPRRARNFIGSGLRFSLLKAPR